MNKNHIELIASELHIKDWQVEHAVTLFQDGATIPFVSRYRKEATGSLDEVQLAAVKSLWNSYEELDKRKSAILRSIEDQEKLTPELRAVIENCWQMNKLEDLYLPYRPKRKTRASIARSKVWNPWLRLCWVSLSRIAWKWHRGTWGKKLKVLKMPCLVPGILLPRL